MTLSFAAITSETILADIATIDEAKISRSVSARYFDFVDAMAEKFSA